MAFDKYEPYSYTDLEHAMERDQLNRFLRGDVPYQVSGHDCYGGTSFFFNEIHVMDAVYYWNKKHPDTDFAKQLKEAYIKEFQVNRYITEINNLIKTLVYHASRCHDDPEPSAARDLGLDMDAILGEVRQNINRNIEYYKYASARNGYDIFYEELKTIDKELRMYGYYLIEEDENAEA